MKRRYRLTSARLLRRIANHLDPRQSIRLRIDDHFGEYVEAMRRARGDSGAM